MSSQQTHSPNANSEHELRIEIDSPFAARSAEIDVAKMALEQSMRTLHGIHVATAAGAAGVGETRPAVQSQNVSYIDAIAPDTRPVAPESVAPARVPAGSLEVLVRAAAQADSIPPSPEVQPYVAPVAPQPVTAPTSLSATTQGF